MKNASRKLDTSRKFVSLREAVLMTNMNLLNFTTRPRLGIVTF
jgi:hypothetical protein